MARRWCGRECFDGSFREATLVAGFYRLRLQFQQHHSQQLTNLFVF